MSFFAPSCFVIDSCERGLICYAFVALLAMAEVCVGAAGKAIWYVQVWLGFIISLLFDSIRVVRECWGEGRGIFDVLLYHRERFLWFLLGIEKTVSRSSPPVVGFKGSVHT